MPKINSEILDIYTKLLEDKGILKEAYPSLEAYKNDPQARAGSDDISTIEALYNVKPETIPGMEYDDNIIETAHPNSVIIAPSYDKINGLVENNIERHNIMSNIALKPNTATHTNPKYARQELVLELVKIANEMDSKNKEELFTLADDCLLSLRKEAFSFDEMSQWFKERTDDAGGIGEGAISGAGIGAAVGGLLTAWTGAGILAGVPVGAATGAVAGGLIAAFTKTTPKVQNIALNAQEVSKQLEDLRKKVPEDASFFDHIDVAIKSLIDVSNKYSTALNTLHEHAIENSTEANVANIEEISKQFVEAVSVIKKMHNEFNRRAAAGEFAKAKPGKALTPIYWFIADDVEDVSDAFTALESAISKLELATKENVQHAMAETPQETSKPKLNKDEGEHLLDLLSKPFK